MAPAAIRICSRTRSTPQTISVTRKRKDGQDGPSDYTVATLTSDIANATQAKESYVREAQDKETRLFALLDGLATFCNDSALLELLRAEGLGERPELAGTYNDAVAQN